MDGGHWIAFALAAAAAWAASCVVDACLVGRRVFRRPLDGAVVAGLFCLGPGLVLGVSADWTPLPPAALASAIAAGVCYFAHVWLYFRALFALNDVSNAEIFNNLCVLFVPVLAFVLLGERLAVVYYVAIGLALAGIVVLIRSQRARVSGVPAVCLFASVLLMSLSMVLQAQALSAIGYAAGGAVFFTAAGFAALVVLAAAGGRRTATLTTLRRFAGLFVLVQLLEVAAVMASHRATDLAPSVSLVALVECMLPVFVVALSAFARLALHRRPALDPGLQPVLGRQLRAWPAKLVSLAMIVAAVASVQFVR